MMRKFILGLMALLLSVPLCAQTQVAVAGHNVVRGGTQTRPLDTAGYGANDLVANSTTAGSVVPITIPNACRTDGGSGMIRRVRFSTTKAGAAGTEVFRIHFFKLSPTVANGDNGAYSVNTVGAIELGYIDATMTRAGSDGSKAFGAPDVGTEILYDCNENSRDIYADVEVRTAYTPASGEVFTLAAELIQD